jgi:hypothetical protein
MCVLLQSLFSQVSLQYIAIVQISRAIGTSMSFVKDIRLIKKDGKLFFTAVQV